MRWKTKAFIQNALSMLPSELSYEAYYRLQRRFGGLRSVTPVVGIRDGMRIVTAIEREGRKIGDSVFLEVGTGRTVATPMTLWLCGASKVITLDLNPYLKSELVQEEIEYIRKNGEAVKELFGDRSHQADFSERFEFLVREKASLDALLHHANIEYIAPGDARKLPLNDQSVDYHTSNNVFEHISPEVLKAILVEGKRVLKQDGLMVHRIDFSDHFSHGDSSISSVNFLQYSEKQWLRYAGNRYMYHNRLRIDEIDEIVRGIGLKIVAQDTSIDEEAVNWIEAGFKLDPRFVSKSKEVNSTETALFVASSNEANIERPVLGHSAMKAASSRSQWAIRGSDQRPQPERY
jgi:hypothetical protein